MRTLLVVCLMLVFAFSALAQVPEKKAPSPEEMQKMMAEYMKIAAPGPAHAVLKKLAGEWTTTSKMWIGGPDAPPRESKGSCTAEMILGDRYVRTSESGEGMMGMPMQGVAYLGYDNFKKKYTMFWVDNMSTAMYTALGDYNDTTKTITLTGKSDDPMTGEKDKDVKHVFRFVDDKTVVLEIWDTVGGKLGKWVETTYTKK